MTTAAQYGFYIDTDRCVGCHACELACKSWNGLEPAVRWRRVLDAWHGDFPEVSRRSFSISCMHCEKPSCRDACPEKAISKRSEDGIVIVDPARCSGCRTCASACPFFIPQYGRNGIMQKCNLCQEKLIRGDAPSCVATCPGEALKFGTIESLAAHSLARSGKRRLASTVPCQFVSGRLSGSDILKTLEKEEAIRRFHSLK
jgi:anaerobic dimethyl sulfoxide reductase subunit B (iron-sulfur subunit)